MPTEIGSAAGSVSLFTLTSNDVRAIADTGDYFDILDSLDFQLTRSSLVTITYSLEVELPSPAENAMLLKAVHILCTLDPTSASLLTGGIECPPSRGVPFGNNHGHDSRRYRGTTSFTWVVANVAAGAHKVVMRGKFDMTAGGPPPSPPPSAISNPKVHKRTLVVQAVPRRPRRVLAPARPHRGRR